MQDEYTSCIWLEGGLFFNQNQLHHCCMPNISKDGKERTPQTLFPERQDYFKKGWPYICSYEGGALPVDEIVKSRQILVSKLNNGEESSCSNCPYLQKKRWPRTESLLKNVVVFSPYTKCNLRCSYCNVIKVRDCQKYYPPLDVITHFVEKKYMSPETTSFGWTGGEPTILKEFNEGYSLISQNVKKVIIYTNSVVFSDTIHRNLGKSNTAETFIKTSIDAGTPDLYKKIKGRDFFYRAFDNLQKYAEKSPQTVFAKYIVLSENCDLHEVRSFIVQVSNRNIKRVLISSDFDLWDLQRKHWAALEILYTELKGHGIDVIFSKHLWALIFASNPDNVPKILYAAADVNKVQDIANSRQEEEN